MAARAGRPPSELLPTIRNPDADQADAEGKRVVCAGLDGDFRRSTFGGMVSLVPLADSVAKLAATCAFCGGKAAFSLRHRGEMAPGEAGSGGGDAEQELVGGADKYSAACRGCYLERTRTVQRTDEAQVSPSGDGVAAAAASAASDSDSAAAAPVPWLGAAVVPPGRAPHGYGLGRGTELAIELEAFQVM